MSLDLDAIGARADAAVAGPWTWHSGDLFVGITADQLDAYNADPEGPCDPFEGKTTEDFSISWGDIVRPEDGEFIAHARDDVPALVAEVRRLQAELTATSINREAESAAADRAIRENRRLRSGRFGWGAL